MTDAPGSPLPSPAAAPKKTNTWIIVIVVVVVICCACFGVAGLIFGFWDAIMQAIGVNLLLPILMVLH